MQSWTKAQIPSQSGKRAIVTGATGGLGYETALALAQAGAEVVVAGRNETKGETALRRIRREYPEAKLCFETLDLANLASVARFSRRVLAAGKPLDMLINNAGVMALAQRQTTIDGFEMQLATNYLGHFALTAWLLPLLQARPGARVVNLSSLAHRQGRIDLDDLHSSQAYRPWKAYAQSKLAMLQFALELQRRSDANGWGLTSLAAHPGWARTDLVANGPGSSGVLGTLSRMLAPLFSHSAADGALPTLFAATAPAVRGGGYYGPSGLYEMKGTPVPAAIMPQAADAEVAGRLWARSTELTGVDW